MYDSTIGRFLQRDPAGYGVAGLDLYVYASDRPAEESDPSGRRSVITQTGTSAWDCKIIVTTMIDFRGEAATKENVEKIVKDIESRWNLGFRYNCCTVEFKVDAQIVTGEEEGLALLARKERIANADAIELKKGGPKANVIDVTTPEKFGANHGGVWYAQTDQQADNFTWTPAHEYGHLLGLADRYGGKGRPGSGKPHEGWEKNIMGAPDQPVEQVNVDEVLDSAVANGLAKLKNYCCLGKPKAYGKPGLALRGLGLLLD